MYAVIKTGGKQYRVEEGQKLSVERLESGPDSTITLTPVLLVDGESVTSAPGMLADASVSARVLADAKGPKVTGFTYKNKSRQSKRWGHRQKYHTIEITGISAGSGATSPDTGSPERPVAVADDGPADVEG